MVRPLGWAVLALGLGTAYLAALAGWREMVVLALSCGLLLVLAAPFLLGRTDVEVELVLEPDRVSAGESVAAGVVVRNTATTRMLPTTLEVGVGSAVHRYGVGALPPGGYHEEAFTIRTERRGAIRVGPALTRRGDALGLFSRDVVWTPMREVLVRPPMTSLDSMGAGLLRDLEGVSTDAVSQSDLAFHALRSYVPGDDLRHVHWRSSAKVMASTGESALLVRQYLDTRRSHAVVVVDDAAEAWPDPDHFEMAMSAAASLVARAILDEFEVTYVCGEHAATGGDGHLALDAVCRSDTGGDGVVTAARRAISLTTDASLAFLLGGAGTGFTDLLRAAAAFDPQVRRVAVLVQPGRRSRITETAGVEVLHLDDLRDLGGLLRWGVR
jgi:uncharacterized protein (DUF58 family)